MVKYLGLISALIALSAVPTAHAEGNFIGVSVTGGTIEVDGRAISSAMAVSGSESGVFGGEISFGREFSNDVYVKAGFEGYDTITVFFSDDVELSSLRAGVGYFVPSKSPFRVFGEVGLARGNLTVTQSPLFNPGPEEEFSDNAIGLYVEAGFEYRFGDHVRAGLSYEFSDYDFGSSKNLVMNLRYKF